MTVVGTGGCAHVHDAVAVNIPHITRLDHVHAIRNGLAIGSRSGGFDDGCDRADWILLNVDDIGIVAQSFQRGCGYTGSKCVEGAELMDDCVISVVE